MKLPRSFLFPIIILGQLFFANLANSQILPSVLSGEQVITQICDKWANTPLVLGGKSKVLTYGECGNFVVQQIKEMQSNLQGLNLVSDDIKGDTQLTSIATKLEREGLRCGNIDRVSDPNFSNLPFKVQCSAPFSMSGQQMKLSLEVFGNNEFMGGGSRIIVTGGSLLGDLPPGNLVEFMEDLFDIGGKFLVPGHAKLTLRFDPNYLEYSEHYLRKPLSTKSGRWIGYVIKLMDYGMNKGHERMAKMIFPYQKTYGSEALCYSEFERVFSEEPLLSRYPQTEDAYSSYIFGCIEK